MPLRESNTPTADLVRGYNRRPYKWNHVLRDNAVATVDKSVEFSCYRGNIVRESNLETSKTGSRENPFLVGARKKKGKTSNSTRVSEKSGET